MNWFLRAKHWQLFLIFFIIPMLSGFAFVIFWVSNMLRMEQSGYVDDQAALQLMSNSMLLLLPCAVLVILLQFAWYWVVGHALYQRLPSDVRMPIGGFRFTSLFPPVYFTFLILGLLFFFEKISNPATNLEPDVIFRFVPFLFLFHFLAIGCMFFNFYFVGKALKSVETGHEVEFSDYLLELVLMWFFTLVGVWLIQPRINKLFAAERS
jgi:hypothetical protein